MKPIWAKYSNNKVTAQGHLLVFSPISYNMHKEIRIEEFRVAYLSKKEPVTFAKKHTNYGNRDL